MRANNQAKHANLRFNKRRSDKFNGLVEKCPSPSYDDLVQDCNQASFSENSAASNSVSAPSRNTVLQACTVTSALIAAMGIMIRQVGHAILTCYYLLFYCIYLGVASSWDCPIWVEMPNHKKTGLNDLCLLLGLDLVFANVNSNFTLYYN